MKAYKAELNPNNKQRSSLVRYAGTSRFVYNWALADRKTKYEKDKKGVSEYTQRKRFNAIKRYEFPWIIDMPYAITEGAFANCKAAYEHFFRRVKGGEEKPGYPKFKNRYGRKSFQLRGTRVEVDRVRLTGAGWVRLKERAYIPFGEGVVYGTYATISERAGRWYISVLVKDAKAPEPEKDDLVIGIDFGVKAIAVLSNGESFENPKHLYLAERKLKRLDRELARRAKGSENRKKTKAKRARAHAKLSDCRSHLLHEISHHVTADLRPKRIVLEDLNVKGMLSNRHLSKAISDVGFHELRRQIEYKADRLGIEVVIADRWFASSKTCSACGARRAALLLSERIFICYECGFLGDRDLNAAVNLSHWPNGEGRNTPGLPVELAPLGGTVKQEAGGST